MKEKAIIFRPAIPNMFYSIPSIMKDIMLEKSNHLNTF